MNWQPNGLGCELLYTTKAQAHGRVEVLLPPVLAGQHFQPEFFYRAAGEQTRVAVAGAYDWDGRSWLNEENWAVLRGGRDADDGFYAHRAYPDTSEAAMQNRLINVPEELQGATHMRQWSSFTPDDSLRTITLDSWH